jgi:hypothetical protein
LAADEFTVVMFLSAVSAHNFQARVQLQYKADPRRISPQLSHSFGGMVIG